MGLLAIYAWRHSTVPAARSVTVLLLLAAGWTLSDALVIASTDLSTGIFWNLLLFIWTLPLPATALAFALQYAGFGGRLTRPHIAALAIIPSLTLLLIVTNDAHGLMWARFWLEDGKLHSSPGMWNWVYSLYSYLLLTLQSVILLRLFLRARGLLRWQTGTILLAWLVPLPVQALQMSNLNPVAPLNLVVMAYTFTGLAYALAIFRFRMLDLFPIVHETVMENLREGTLVLDFRKRLVDINPVAQRILGIRASSVIGQDAIKVLDEWKNLIALLRDPSIGLAEVRIDTGAEPLYYNARILPLIDFRGFQLGQVILLFDITGLKRIQERLFEQERTRAALAEREKLAWELHDGLAQMVGFISVQARAVNELLETGKTQEAKACVKRLATVAGDLHFNVREMIADFSAVTLPNQDFYSILRQRLEQFSQEFGIDAKLVVADEVRRMTFEPMVPGQLLRIIQEALTNARKHASAQHLSVSFAPDTRYVQVVIADDGIGFDPVEFTDDSAKYGLRIMHARATMIGGHLQISSAPRLGTKVIVQIPWREDLRSHDSLR